MNKKLKNDLKEAFEGPGSADKEQFLKTLRYPKITYQNFILCQFRFIRKRIWMLSAVIVFAGWAVAFLTPLNIEWYAEPGKIRTASAALPFLALLTAVEIYRSVFCRMAELEMSCRFSLIQIIMARIAILGGGNFFILTLLLIFISRASPYSLLQVFTYLMVPYLITCGICLLILNRVRGRESLYYCTAASCLVCGINAISGNTVQFLYSNSYLIYWLLLLAASGLFIGIQMLNLLKQTEDRTWNLLLTE